MKEVYAVLLFLTAELTGQEALLDSALAKPKLVCCLILCLGMAFLLPSSLVNLCL